MRIGVIADPPIITHSCAVVASQLAKQWIKQGHEVFYLGYNYQGRKVRHVDGYDIYPDTVPPTRKQSVLNFINEVGGLDILYSHGSKDIFAEGMAAAKERGIPFVPHTFYSTPVKTDKVTTFEARKGFILYDCANVNDMFVCNNFSVGVGYALGKRTWYVPNGVDTDIFHTPGTVNLPGYREELGLKQSDFVFLFSGSNISGKDPGRALNAFAEFQHKYKYDDTYLVMHTRPTTNHLDLKQISKDLGVEDRVKFFTDYFPEWLEQPEADKAYNKGEFSPPYTTTPYSEMGDMFRTGDVQIVPTLMEGQSTTILEGMACGLPTICSDDPVVSEIVVPYETGLLCRRLLTNENVTEDMVKNMHTFYADRLETKIMGARASRYVSIRHNWKSIAKQFIYHFTNLIDKYYE